MLETWYELTNKTWGTVLAETVEQYPEVELMVCGDRRVTYGEFYPQTQSFARGLLALGVLPGENIALWMTNPGSHQYASRTGRSCRFAQAIAGIDADSVQFIPGWGRGCPALAGATDPGNLP
jgi:acyl-CoA synthetase (AMP-forming)/AMP-acid ligase II